MADDFNILDSVSGGSSDATASNQDEQTALLTSLATLILARDSAPAAAQPGVASLSILDVALTDQSATDDDGDLTLERVDTYGAKWVQLAGALSALVDSITTAPGIPPGATAFDKHYNNTAAAGAGAAATVIDPPSGQCIVITDLIISSYSATAGKVILYLGADADTTYTIDTDQIVAVANFIPSATVSPGLGHPFRKPVKSLTANHQLKYQNDAAIDVDIYIGGWYYTP